MKYKQTTCFINLKQIEARKMRATIREKLSRYQINLISLQFFRIVATIFAAVNQTF